MNVYFETLVVLRNNIVKVWLYHPHRMLFIDLNELIRREQECKNNSANSFTLENTNYIEYKSLPPFQDSKMAILIEVNPKESLTRSDSAYAPREYFILQQEEFDRIVSTAQSLLRVFQSWP